jgi:hypothetical protein
MNNHKQDKSSSGILFEEQTGRFLPVLRFLIPNVGTTPSASTIVSYHEISRKPLHGPRLRKGLSFLHQHREKSRDCPGTCLI